MGRNSNSRQQQQDANELLNFRFSTSASSRQDSSVSANNSNNNTGSNNSRINNRGGNHHGRNNRNQHKNNRRRSAQDRASVRQKADSSMFYLHSSAEHTFLLSRRSPSKMNPNEYSFHGSDHSVSWESVKMVQQAVPISNNANDDGGACCPICLCDFVCARISKCGHSFCLPCILRHVQTYAANNPYHPVRCPCCGIPIIASDMRPVVMEAVRPVVLQHTLRLRKLHRQKGSSVPFLPLQGAPQHSNPHFVPTFGVDPDARYSRFNYLDPDVYHASLVANQGELQRELKDVLGCGLATSSVEVMYLSVSLDMVLEEQQKAQQEAAEEKTLMARFACSNSGMYQPQSPALVFKEENENSVYEEANSNNNVSANVSDNHNSKNEPSLVQRYRGDSVGSYKSVDTASTPCSNQHDCEGDLTTGKALSPSSKNRNSRRKPHKKCHGSMYLDTSTAVHLYQAEDGQLVFLNGFNMTCLLSDFSKGPPSDAPSLDGTETGNHQGEYRETNSRMQSGPLPDFLEGRVLEKENVHLTSNIRKRMPFLNHIPLFTDIVFVELDLNHVLSDETRRKFKNEIAKRRKKRQSKTQAEKRADLQTQKEDRDRINARKARLRTVDPNDEFFQVSVVPPPEPVAEGAEFGPVPGGERSSNGVTHEAVVAGRNIDDSLSQPPSSSSFSFSQAAQRARDAEAFPTLSSSEAFPTLGSRPSPAPTLPRGGSSTWRSGKASAKIVASATVAPGMAAGNPGGKKKKKRAQKLVLFSTGGARGY